MHLFFGSYVRRVYFGFWGTTCLKRLLLFIMVPRDRGGARTKAKKNMFKKKYPDRLVLFCRHTFFFVFTFCIIIGFLLVRGGVVISPGRDILPYPCGGRTCCHCDGHHTSSHPKHPRHQGGLVGILRDAFFQKKKSERLLRRYATYVRPKSDC